MATPSQIRSGALPGQPPPHGSSNQVSALPRKKIKFTLDSHAQGWIKEVPKQSQSREFHFSLQHVAEILLPVSVLQLSQRYLLKALVTDIAIPLCSYLAVSQLLASAPEAWSLPRPPSVGLWASLLTWTACYAAVFASLAIPERLYDASPARTTLLHLGKLMFWSTFTVFALQLGCHVATLSVTSILLSAPLSFLAMNTYRNRAASRPSRSRHSKNVLIIGAGDLGQKVAKEISSSLSCVRNLVGFIDEGKHVTSAVLGGFAQLETVAALHFVDEIILAVSDRKDTAQWLAHVARRNRIDVTLAIDPFGFRREQLDASENNIPLVKLFELKRPLFDLSLKRIFDVILSIVAMLFFIPTLALIALLIRLDSPGPALYRAPRVGHKGRRFECLKFRTMVTNADALKNNLRSQNERLGPLFKVTRDPRITRVGLLLRRYSLDELPQLWNVLVGEMSLVGPRPHPLDDFAQYRISDLQRLRVTPGITGLWQVTARRDPSFETNMALDIQYIENWSLWMDLKILCQTFFTVWEGTGA